MEGSDERSEEQLFGVGEGWLVERSDTRKGAQSLVFECETQELHTLDRVCAKLYFDKDSIQTITVWRHFFAPLPLS